MSDEKKKCSGCGREVTGDIGWCMSCRSILYTDLLIARTDFSGSQFKTLVFPVRDIIWMQDRIRLREAELKAADDTNDMIAAELARLRADLAESRADVARFEAALDVANRELAEAREKDAELAAMRQPTITPHLLMADGWVIKGWTWWYQNGDRLSLYWNPDDKRWEFGIGRIGKTIVASPENLYDLRELVRLLGGKPDSAS